MGTSEVPSTVAVGISTPCEGRVAQAPRTTAIETADSVNIRPVLRTEVYSHSYMCPQRADENIGDHQSLASEAIVKADPQHVFFQGVGCARAYP
jgi:hypothetical protein